MSREKAEIKIVYEPEEEGAHIRCDYAGDDPDDRDDRVQELFEAVRDTVHEELEAEGLHPLAGGEETGENAVSYGYGTEDDIPQA